MHHGTPAGVLQPVLGKDFKQWILHCFDAATTIYPTSRCKYVVWRNSAYQKSYKGELLLLAVQCQITEWFELERRFNPPAMGRDIFHYIRLLKVPSNPSLKHSNVAHATRNAGPPWFVPVLDICSQSVW